MLKWFFGHFIFSDEFISLTVFRLMNPPEKYEMIGKLVKSVKNDRTLRLTIANRIPDKYESHHSHTFTSWLSRFVSQIKPDPVLYIVGALLLSFTPIHARSESCPKAPKSLLAIYLPIRSPEHILSSSKTTRNPNSTCYHAEEETLSILTNYLTDDNYMHLERNKLRSNGPPPLSQGTKRRVATEVDHTT